jgi:hypothetical protein
LIRLALVAAMVVGAAPAAAAPAVRGLDHGRHAAVETAAGAAATSCAGCHALDARGAPRRADHRTCFARCHQPAPPRRTPGRPYPIDADRLTVCEVCHPASLLAAAIRGDRDRLIVAAAPADSRDHALSMSHAAHAAESCQRCHRFPAPRAPLVHGRCAGCHRGSAAATPALDACQTCHRDAGGTAAGAARSPYAVGARFDHRRHGPRVAAAGAPACASCHPGIAELAAGGVPTPTKAACTGCHDGEPAFSTIAPACRRCHPAPAAGAPRQRSRESRFAHRPHGELACLDCHPDGEDFEARVGHTMCGREGCHAGDFAAPEPVTCSVCHVGSEPWLDHHLDPPRRGPGDHGIVFDHAVHDRARGGERPCASCHSGDPDGEDAGLARAHASCAGGDCHGDSAAPAPAMDRCGDCHRAGLRARRRRAAINRPWSVTGSFSHRSHRLDGGGATVECRRCHGAARAGKPLPPPAKASCLPCHDGRVAFKTTGHDCSRCHSKLRTATGSR